MRADYIVARRTPSLNLPVLAPIFAPIGSLLNSTAVLELSDEIKQRGGMVLSPDEYMASLNPEYMLALAAERLSNSDSNVRLAANLMQANKYLDSLMTSRGALAP